MFIEKALTAELEEQMGEFNELESLNNINAQSNTLNTNKLEHLRSLREHSLRRLKSINPYRGYLCQPHFFNTVKLTINKRC